MEDEAKKKISMAAVAAVASAGVLVGGMFNSPADLVENPMSSAIDRAFPPAAVEVFPADSEENPAEPEEKNKSGLDSTSDDPEGSGPSGGERPPETGNAVRSGILRLPLFVRAAAGVPLWCVGWVLIHAAEVSWSFALAPVLKTVLGWIAVAFLILAASAVTVKALFPKLPMKSILNRRTFLITVIGILVLALLDVVLPLLWDGYDRVSFLLIIVASTVVLFLILFPFLRRKIRIHRSETI